MQHAATAHDDISSRAIIIEHIQAFLRNSYLQFIMHEFILEGRKKIGKQNILENGIFARNEIIYSSL